MSDDTTISVNADERRLISALRDIPDGSLRLLTGEVMTRLLEFVREPRCAEIQGDGVPCDRPEADCEQCTTLREIITRLRDTLPPA